jgi:hypothetical protein
MRLLPGYLIAFVLAMLLACTTPAGTGAGVHQFDLLHPVFSHVHLINGRLVTHEEMAQAREGASVPPPAPGKTAFGAGQPAAAADGGLGVSPTLPGWSNAIPWDGAAGRVRFQSVIPHGLKEAPPDPPPL